MNRSSGVAIALLLAIGRVPPAVAGLADGEISVLGETAAGDYGTGIGSDTQWLTMRYVTGDDLQFRVDLSMVRVASYSGASFTGLGPVSAGGNGSLEGTRSGIDGSTTAPTVYEGSRTAGLGDLYLAVSRRVLGGGVRLFRFDANLEVKVPTADDNLGTGEWDYRVGLAGDYRFWSAAAYGGVGWNRLGDPVWADLDDVLDVYAGIESNPVMRERLILGGWVEGRQAAIDSIGHRAALGVGLRTTGKVRWRLQLRTGLTDATADVAVLFGVSFGVSPPGPGIRGPQS